MTAVILLLSIFFYFGLLYAIAFTASKHHVGNVYDVNKKAPWWVVAVGLIGTAISGVTFMSVPGLVSTTKGMSYFEFVLGNFVGMLIITFFLLPLYYRVSLNSIYVYIGNRFGKHTHQTAAGLFIFSRTIGSVFRLYLGCIALHITVFSSLGIPFWITGTLFVVAIWLYTKRGGIQSIIWTDFFQTLVIIAVAIATFWMVVSCMDIPMQMLYEKALSSDHTQIFMWGDFVSNENHFVKQFLSGIFVTIAMSGLDQDMMQKNLKLKTIAEAQKNYVWFSVMFVVVNFFFLVLGLLFYLLLNQEGQPIPIKTDTIYAFIAEHYLGIAGMVLFVVGIMASTFSSCAASLLAIASSFHLDIKNNHTTSPPQKPQSQHKTHNVIAFVFLVILFIFHFLSKESVAVVVFKVAGYTYGPLLAFFAVGLFSSVQVVDKWTPYIAVSCVILSILADYFSESIFYGYRFGFEIILLNALLTAMGLYLSSFFTRKNRK